MDRLPAATSPLLDSPDDAGVGSDSEAYGLEELLAVAGERLGEEISPRTVRLYATQGLIDRPGKEGRSAVYGRRHLLQLLLIRSLARRGLSLAAIAPICGLPDADLKHQLWQLEGSGSLATAALDAVSSEVPGTDSTGVALSQSSHQERNQALAYLHDLQPTSASGSKSPSFEEDTTEGTASLLPFLGSPLSSLSPSRASPSRSASRSSARSSSSRDASSRWHRFSLAPGVELQISDAVSIPPAGSRRTAWLHRLALRLIEQLEDGPP